MKEQVKPPKVQVKIPTVHLRLEDIAYLRSMDNRDGIRCELREHRKNRLRVLRLIETRNVAPSKEDSGKLNREIRGLAAKAGVDIKAGRWAAARSAIYSIEAAVRRLEPRPRDILTDLGKALLKSGSVTVQMKKAGCV